MEVALYKRLTGVAVDWKVAVKLLMPQWRRMSGRAAAQPYQPMNREFEARFTAILLTLLTVAAVLFAGFNYKIEHQSRFPTTARGGWSATATWSRTAWSRTVRQSGPVSGAATRWSASTTARSIPAAVTRQIYYSGVWSKATYSLVRGAVPLDVEVVLVPAERSMNDWLRLIALIYLGIGLYVLLRRWTAVGSTHFYIFCLVSFVFYSLHYTGKFNAFDWIVLWANERVAAAAGPVPALRIDLSGTA
jgi:two-component system NtrC family sensor kinase